MEEVTCPAWTFAAFDRAAEDIVSLVKLVELSVQGIHGLRGAPEAVRLAATLDALLEPVTAKPLDPAHLAHAERTAETVREIQESGFIQVYYQAAVSLWSTLENGVKEAATDWIRCDKSILKHDLFKRIKIRIGDYEALPEDERPAYLADLIDQEVSAPLASGINRFENVLEVLGLSGPIEDDVRTAIYQLGQLRNVIVHRRGLADRRFVAACPSLGYQVGDRVRIAPALWRDLSFASVRYLRECFVRAHVKFGVAREDVPRMLGGKRLI